MERYHGPRGALVEALRRGDGDEGVLFLHSSASGVQQWRAYQEELSGRYATATVHLCGYGGTSAWDGPDAQRLEDQAALVQPVLDALDRPTHLVGHSFGGAVALELARRCADRILSVTVFEPVLFWPLREAAPSAWAEIRQVMHGVQAGVATADLHAAAARFVDYWAQRPVWEQLGAAQQAAVAAAMPAVAHEWDAATTPPPDPRGWLAHVPAPTLVVVAGDSLAVVHDVASILTADGRRRLHGIARGGHMAPVTRAPEVLAVARAFIEAHSADVAAPLRS